MSEPWLSTDEIAAHLGVTKDTVYAWIADKGMPAHKIGRLWKCQASEVDDWVRTGAAASDAPHPDEGGDPYPKQAHGKKERR
ncbi:helix-turn-helix domain-containing protein [Propionibacterium acidifaciens]|uniref:helix-turn-helix domain-containing protein n=1 Tax=Propionibacterium acidifaciens TaxID=556499 RepID=UPI0028EFDA20|nr:helix-turn-helix domain-containing protein [Propionibacterium acidifaciens]